MSAESDGEIACGERSKEREREREREKEKEKERHTSRNRESKDCLRIEWVGSRMSFDSRISSLPL